MKTKTRSVSIDPEVERVLANLTIEGNVVKRITEQLPRDLYIRVNNVLEALGGKWNRSAQGHVFAGDPREKIAEALGAGRAVDVKKTVEYFATPVDVAWMMVSRAGLQAGMKVLEPSAGQGAIADVIRDACPSCKIDLVEFENENRKVLKAKGYKLVGKDFLKFKKKGYDRIFMNPPFSGQQDMDHVTHAMKLLKPGGRLVSIMSPGVKFRENKKALAFQALFDRSYGHLEDLPPGTFAESGTGVGAVIVSLQKV